MFTPKGDVITLPARSTPVDFAYAVHTEVGHRCIGSRVNGRLVALERALESGDVVEIFTSKAETAGPSRDWLAFVASPRAKTKIKQWFAKERREEAIEAGKDAIAREARRTGDAAAAAGVGRRDGRAGARAALPGPAALYAAVGEGHVERAARGPAAGRRCSAARRRPRRSSPSGPRRRRSASASGGEAGVVVRGDDGDVGGLYTKLARCCTPVPGDDILGFVTRGGGVSVHRVDCTNAGDLQARSERLVDVAWSVSPGSVFLVAIQAEALDRHRLLSDITKVLADEKVNILSASVADVARTGWPISRFTFEMGDPKHLGHVLRAVRNVEGVYDVYRVTQPPEPAPPQRAGRPSGTTRPPQETVAVWISSASSACRHPSRCRRPCPRPPPCRSSARPSSSIVPKTVYSGGSVASA